VAKNRNSFINSNLIVFRHTAGHDADHMERGFSKSHFGPKRWRQHRTETIDFRQNLQKTVDLDGQDQWTTEHSTDFADTFSVRLAVAATRWL
jgi:hypothetical protein